ncbi:PAS domain-containing hybrid sensor histidine kinase/response regulator [Marinobacterium jannaschii]|uniref:PAS domain-containing hybrid sensor histidine kinase/response regulator n=1 Tax=Marinobacterium jannaschii TaxID=64970 RepID=UPI0004826FD4|nr:NahK/ErcS family hybrid sensor histidine kinase/response regulator [Marinobacterium jannaschii]
MKKPSKRDAAVEAREEATFQDLIGLGTQSARKSYYAELEHKIDELETERNRYKWLFDHALHGIFRADISGKLLAVNPAMARLCGYRDGEQLSGALDQQAAALFFHDGDFEQLTLQLQESGSIEGYETLMARAGGEPVCVSINLLLRQDADQDQIEAFVQDITERRRNQDQLKQMNAELEARVEKRTRELTRLNSKLWVEISEREQIQRQLEAAKEDAEQANLSKDKYLAAASHDLLQPMNAARLLVSALRERSLGSDEKHLVERVHLALDGAEELLTDLLEISRLDQNAVQPERDIFAIDHVLSGLVEEFQPVASQAGLTLSAIPSRLAVETDLRLLRRILRNFISNAIRYTASGRILIGCRRQQGQLSIQIWDTGDGIAPEQLDEIFQEFRQLQRKKGSERKGVGLGLAIVDRIARVLEHPIRVHSVPGKGSMFAVDVPTATLPAVRNQRLSQGILPSDALQGARILVIDNEENILISMQALLAPWGCELQLACDQQEAIGLCRQDNFKPDLVLADYHLDDDRLGTEAIRAVRDMLGEQVPAVIITADRSDESRQLFRRLKLPVLNKPLKPGKLRALLTHLLG